jgi:hypothetical protein
MPNSSNFNGLMMQDEMNRSVIASRHKMDQSEESGQGTVSIFHGRHPSAPNQ